MDEETSPLSPVSPAEPIDDTKTDEHNEREVLKTFISVYRQNPILWNTSLKEYSDRDKKNKCYKQLVEIYQKIKKRATIEDVKKKINSLRTNYRKELKKIKDSQRTGSSTDDIYEPTSWIFWELQFLNDVEKLDNTRSTVPEEITVSIFYLYYGTTKNITFKQKLFALFLLLFYFIFCCYTLFLTLFYLLNNIILPRYLALVVEVISVGISDFFCIFGRFSKRASLKGCQLRL